MQLVAPDIIVVGASAGGVSAVETLINSLPRDLNAAVFVVIHVMATAESMLPRIFSRNGNIPVLQAGNNMKIEHGTVYVAPPDFHLILDPDHMQLWRGPRESNHRPAINALFRSASSSFGKRVIGIVMTGMLDDGSAGLWWIKKNGGIAIVQDPKTAAFPEMPNSALSYVAADYVLRVEEMGPLLSKLTHTEGGKGTDGRKQTSY